MPIYHTLDWPQQSLRLYLKPRGRVRRLFRRISPYLSGDILDLELVVKCRSDAALKYDFEWQLQDVLPDRSSFRVLEHQAGTFVSKPRGATSVQLSTHLIQYEAEYHLILNSLKRGDEQAPAQTLLNFGALARDAYHQRWFVGLMSGFVGGIIGVIVGILLHSR